MAVQPLCIWLVSGYSLRLHSGFPRTNRLKHSPTFDPFFRFFGPLVPVVGLGLWEVELETEKHWQQLKTEKPQLFDGAVWCPGLNEPIDELK